MGAAPFAYRLSVWAGAFGTTLWVLSITALETVIGILLFVPLFAGWKLVTQWPSVKIMHHLIWLYGRVWLALARPVILARYEGFTKNTFNTPCIIVANHLSFWDTFLMGGLPAFDITFAVRGWPFRIICYSYFMRLARYLNIEENSWEQTLAQAKEELAMGRHLFFYPEGHRSRNGQLGRFYSGAFRVAVETGSPILPLCITGTDRFHPPGRKWVMPATAQVKVLEPISPTDFIEELSHAAMRKHVKQRMQEELDSLRAKGDQ